jgi:hypothetical protein
MRAKHDNYFLILNKLKIPLQKSILSDCSMFSSVDPSQAAFSMIYKVKSTPVCIFRVKIVA